VMGADGSGQKRLTDNLGWDTHPTFSPDGSKIAFTTTRDGNYEIYVMGTDGWHHERLTFDQATDLEPTYLPYEKK
jgi:Tol biopolymer transport system component